MAGHAVSLLTALTTWLNAQVWTQSFTAARVWVVDHALTELTSLVVEVTAGPLSVEPIGRADDQWIVNADIVLAKKINPNTNTPIDDLSDQFEEIVTALRGRQITDAAGNNWACRSRAPLAPEKAAISPELLKEWRSFLAVLRTEWMKVSG